jgi:hypothetical protein
LSCSPRRSCRPPGTSWTETGGRYSGRPLSGTAGRRAALVILTPCTAAVTAAGLAPQSPSAERLLARLDQVSAWRLPVLLRGERGTGKATLARRLHAREPDAGPLTVLDAADRTQPPREWIAQLRAALTDSAGTVVLLHLDALDEALMEPAARLLASPRAQLVATLTDRPELTDQFPVVLDVPPLRERAGDIPADVSDLDSVRALARTAHITCPRGGDSPATTSAGSLVAAVLSPGGCGLPG